MLKGKVLIAQGGGPTAVINQSLVGAVLAARKRQEITGILGARHGIAGIMAEDFVDLTTQSKGQLERVAHTPAAALGSVRLKPGHAECARVLEVFRKHDVRYFFYIGGNDSAETAHIIAEMAKAAHYEFCTVHIPKTIDNDLPLPGDIPNFGFETARQLGFELVHNLMEDSRTPGRWYIVVVMGRTAGHLALGIGKAAGATLTIIPEEFSGPVHLNTVCDILEGAILKRRALWNRADGVAIVAEGLLERVPAEELSQIEGVRIAPDSYGHLTLAELDLAYLLNTLADHRFGSRGTPLAIVHKNIGYEVRSAAPIAFDCEYVRSLGYGAVDFLLSGNPALANLSGALVCLVEGKLQYLDFATLLDPKTGKSRIRLVDVHKPAYKVAREYMIRLEKEDLENAETVRLLAQAASSQTYRCAPDELRARFHHLVEV